MNINGLQLWSNMPVSDSLDAVPISVSTARLPRLPDDSDSARQSSETEKTVLQKRRRVNEPRMAHPRKRAITACQFCRSRKTKCDNQRPSCGTCTSLHVECIYVGPEADMSSFDQASLTIIDRLDYAIQLLGALPLLTASQLAASTIPSQLSPGLTRSGSAPADFLSVLDAQSPDGLQDLNEASLAEALSVSANCSSGSILTWPVFESGIPCDEILAAGFLPEVNATTTLMVRDLPMEKRSLPRQISGRGRGVREEDVSVFVDDFLRNVHIKNPILDANTLLETTRQISEVGFGWDGDSCLVLIACALANLSVPFSANPPTENESSLATAKDYSTAEQYYTSARKRTGLLETSVVTVQCFFLVGVYEMYSLRPLRAWLSFNHACTVFQTYLYSRSSQAISRSSRHLEQRLYWSCLKSECEMRDEVKLPPSNLAKVGYPDVLPSPPGGTPEPEAFHDHAHVSDPLGTVHHRSWYYYLSEIAFRRIANRIASVLHGDHPSQWLQVPLKRLQRVATELEGQVTRWFEHIPATFDVQNSLPTDELTFMLLSRYLDSCERIWRPFLYLLIHKEGISPTEHATIVENAQKCVDMLFKYIEHLNIKHRHHGSWYGGRQLFSKSLLILAAAKSKRVAMPENWTVYVEIAQRCIKFWEDEAADLKVARRALDDLYEQVKSSLDQGILDNDGGEHGVST